MIHLRAASACDTYHAVVASLVGLFDYRIPTAWDRAVAEWDREAQEPNRAWEEPPVGEHPDRAGRTPRFPLPRT